MATINCLCLSTLQINWGQNSQGGNSPHSLGCLVGPAEKTGLLLGRLGLSCRAVQPRAPWLTAKFPTPSQPLGGKETNSGSSNSWSSAADSLDTVPCMCYCPHVRMITFGFQFLSLRQAKLCPSSTPWASAAVPCTAAVLTMSLQLQVLKGMDVSIGPTTVSDALTSWFRNIGRVLQNPVAYGSFLCRGSALCKM